MSEHILKVYYTYPGKDIKLEDGYADQAAGIAHTSFRKTSMEVMELTYVFKSDEELQRAKFRLKEDGFRFYP